MTLQDLIEKLRRYPVPTICGAIVLACFFSFYLRMNLLVDLEIENDEAQRQVQQVEQNINHGKTLAADIDLMKKKVEELDARIIKPAELATNLKYFYEIEAATGVSIADLRQSVTPPAKGAPKTILGSVDYTVQVNGRFDQIIAYITELERGRHFYRLESLAIQRGRADTATPAATPVTMSLNLDLLGWP